MKKLLVLILAIILAFSLVACGGKECETHLDTDGNGHCDNCGVEMEKKPCADDAHRDTDNNGKCDVCDAEVPVEDDNGNDNTTPSLPGNGGSVNTPIIPLEPEYGGGN